MTDYTTLDEPKEQSRPFGVYAIIGLQILNIAASLSDFIRLQLGLITLNLPNIEDSRWIGALNVIIALLLVLVIIGLWRYAKWSWFAVMILSGIALLFSIWQYTQGGEPYATLLINALVVFYLNQSSVRHVFEDQPPASQDLEAVS